MKMAITLLMMSIAFTSVAIAQTVPSKTGSKVNQQQAQAALEFHNKVRKDVGLLRWNGQLS